MKLILSRLISLCSLVVSRWQAELKVRTQLRQHSHIQKTGREREREGESELKGEPPETQATEAKSLNRAAAGMG